ncbi:MAG: VOC family protein [Pseudomonadota bacterium]
MIGYVMLGTNDRPKAEAFYDAIFGEIGVKRLFEVMHITAWGEDMSKPFFCICTPLDRNEANVGNGGMVALRLESPEQVDKLHAKALELGAENEGKPGRRPAGLYCAYFRDPDGNKLNFHAA